jgi:peptide chain release factor 1
MTDHRIDLTLYSLDRIIEGEITDLLDALKGNDLDQRIAAALEAGGRDA